jgi:RNA polymerase sigma factor (sigma-70 family)
VTSAPRNLTPADLPSLGNDAVVQYAPMLHGIVRRYAYSDLEHDDLWQLAAARFALAWDAANPDKGPAARLGYAKAAATFAVLTACKNRKRKIRLLPMTSLDAPLCADGSALVDILPDSRDIPADTAAIANDQAARVREAVQTLLPRDQTLIRRLFWQSQSREQIAADTDHTRQAIQHHIRRIFKTLRKRIRLA